MNTIDDLIRESNPRREITIQGHKVPLLFTPAMLRHQLRDKAKLDESLDTTDQAAVWQAYVKLFYMSYLNLRDLREIDNSVPRDEPKYNLADFEVWASGEGRKECAELLPVAVYHITGHALRYYIERVQQLN